VSLLGKFFKTKIAVGEIWCILGQRMITYDRAILGGRKFEIGTHFVTAILLQGNCLDDFNDTE